jgi:hypothetical protein
MTLSDARAAYETLSGKASDIMRQLGLGGLALVWLFRVDTGKGPVLDKELLLAALFICVAIIFDFLQYVVGATIWFRHFRRKEREGVEDDATFKAHPHLNWPTWTLFYLKSAALLIAYTGYIIPFLIRRFAV